MASTSTITSLGVGSGLDAESIVTKLVTLERLPITQLQTQAEKFQAKISAFGQIQSAVSTFRDAARKLANPDIWGSVAATSANTSVVNFSTSTGAANGNYAVTVSSLAKAQSTAMRTAVSATDTLGSGTLTFNTGVMGTGGIASPTKTTQVTIDATDTLDQIKDKVNAAGAGVRATVVTDANGSRLVFTSSEAGKANAFTVSADTTGGTAGTAAVGLSALAYSGTDNLTEGERTQEASNAVAKVNGVQVESATNTFSGALAGITFTVGQTTAADAPVNVTVAQDTETITKAINDFATSYTAMVNLMRDNTKYDDATQTAGTLQGDGTALALLNQFRSLAGSSTTASSTYGTLSSIGVAIQEGGGLKVDSTKLKNALGNLTEVKKLFSFADTGNSSNDGIATKLRTLADNMLAFDGARANRTNGLRSAVTRNQKQQDVLDARSALYEKRLRAQYTALDTTMATLNTASNYVTQMINAYNKS